MALERSEAAGALEQFKESVVLLHQNLFLRLARQPRLLDCMILVRLYEKVITPLPPSEFGSFQADMEAVRGALARQAIAQEWAVCQELSLDEAVPSRCGQIRL